MNTMFIYDHRLSLYNPYHSNATHQCELPYPSITAVTYKSNTHASNTLQCDPIDTRNLITSDLSEIFYGINQRLCYAVQRRRHAENQLVAIPPKLCPQFQSLYHSASASSHHIDMGCCPVRMEMVRNWRSSSPGGKGFSPFGPRATCRTSP